MSRPWMPLYVGDYIADTAHLSAAEHGAYLLLMMHYWQKGSLPQDDQSLARIARMTAAEWRKSRTTIQAFFSENWKHKRIEFELTEAERISMAGRTGGLASGKKRRREPNDRSTTVQRPLNDPMNDQGNDSPTICEALQSKKESKKESKKGSEASASDADASSVQPPVYTDSKHELWGEGVPILVSLGLKNREARSNIGRWLRDCRDDAQRVLGAIQRARDARVIDPIPWITRAISNGGTANEAARGRNGGGSELGRLIRQQREDCMGEGGEAPSRPPPRLLSNG